jgi:hypothetical protein
MTSLVVRDEEPQPIESIDFDKPLRFFSATGIGTYSAQGIAKLARLAVESGASRFASYGLGFDANFKSIHTAIEETKLLNRTWKQKLRHPLQRYPFKVFLHALNGSDRLGFNRDLLECAKSIKKDCRIINRGVAQAKAHDIDCGGNTAIRYKFASMSGGHSPAQWVLNHEEVAQGLNGFKIGLSAIPKDPSSKPIFKQIFPLMLASKRYGCKGWILTDNNLASSHRPVAKQDELELRTLLAANTAYTYDSSQPGPGDIFKTLLNASNGFLSVSAIDAPLITRRIWKKLWRKRGDRKLTISMLSSMIQQVLFNPKTQLIDAEIGYPQYIFAVGNFKRNDFYEALDQTQLPHNVEAIPAPSKSATITVGRIAPIKGRIQSVENLFNLENNTPSSTRYTLPEEITQKSIEKLWPIVERVADTLDVSPEDMLEGN